jgi:regulator of cell morphogenesis and NO signaling
VWGYFFGLHAILLVHLLTMFQNQTLSQLIHSNHKVAMVLLRLGIPFYKLEKATLAQACEECRVPLEFVKDSIQKLLQVLHSPSLDFEKFSLQQICDYLESTHHLYVAQRLPEISTLLELLHSQLEYNQEYLLNISEEFKKFVKHFSKHIAYEEQNIFPYIAAMENQIGNNIANKIDLMLPYASHFNISEIAKKHAEEDDELQELRRITDDFKVLKTNNILYMVSMLELKDFEEDLAMHSFIEEQILLPRALEFEKYLKKKVKQLSIRN